MPRSTARTPEREAVEGLDTAHCGRPTRAGEGKRCQGESVLSLLSLYVVRQGHLRVLGGLHEV
jgi:hypothetical protein